MRCEGEIAWLGTGIEDALVGRRYGSLVLVNRWRPCWRYLNHHPIEIPRSSHLQHGTPSHWSGDTKSNFPIRSGLGSVEDATYF